MKNHAVIRFFVPQNFIKFKILKQKKLPSRLVRLQQGVIVIILFLYVAGKAMVIKNGVFGCVPR